MHLVVHVSASVLLSVLATGSRHHLRNALHMAMKAWCPLSALVQVAQASVSLTLSAHEQRPCGSAWAMPRRAGALQVAMNVNWGGFFGLGPKGLGLVGASKAQHHGVPYALTEEFTAVYRMHPLLPDYLPVEGEADVEVADVLGAAGALCSFKSCNNVVILL